MTSIDHIHKYEKKTLSRKKDGFVVFKCQKPGCTHYLNAVLIEGRLAECWRCGANFAIDKRAAQLKKPHCKHCTVSKKKEEVYSDAALDLLTKMIGG